MDRAQDPFPPDMLVKIVDFIPDFRTCQAMRVAWPLLARETLVSGVEIYTRNDLRTPVMFHYRAPMVSVRLWLRARDLRSWLIDLDGREECYSEYMVSEVEYPCLKDKPYTQVLLTRMCRLIWVIGVHGCEPM